MLSCVFVAESVVVLHVGCFLSSKIAFFLGLLFSVQSMLLPAFHGLKGSMLSAEIDDDSVLSPQSYLHLSMHGGD